jgi:site-specific DNA-cytosine methylase
MQSENKDDSFQFSARYWAYDFAKQHLRGTSRPEVFPIGGNKEVDNGTDAIANTLTSNYWKGPAASRPFIQERGDRSNNCNIIRREAYSNDSRIRRLTPTECARLQGFPDDWHKVDGISDTQAYKCYGNAVTVNVVEYLIEKITT